MKKLFKKLVLWHCRNYRLNTPQKVFKHLAKHFEDYDDYFLCWALNRLYLGFAINEKTYIKTKALLKVYLNLYAKDFGSKNKIKDNFWPILSQFNFPYHIQKQINIENKKKFLRFIAEKEVKK